MDKKAYIIKQFARTNHKSYENYCITRIFHLLNNLDVQFVTQQMFKRSNERIALADLYLPQIDMIIEIDEGHHLKNAEEDKKRTEEIINNKVKVFEEVITYNLEPERIDVTKGIEEINDRIDKIVSEINDRISDPKKPFVPWTGNYLTAEDYIKVGELNVEESPSFKTIQDIANLFNRYSEKKSVYKDGKYIGTQKAYFEDKPGSGIWVWCPKLTINDDDYKNNPYLNTISDDGNRICELIKDSNASKQFLDEYMSNDEKSLAIRIVFAKYKDSIGEDRYKFRGIFSLNKEESVKTNCRVWDKISNKLSLAEYHG